VQSLASVNAKQRTGQNGLLCDMRELWRLAVHLNNYSLVQYTVGTAVFFRNYLVVMTNITPDLIKKLITDPSGKLFVPETITNAIGSCVFSDVDVVKQKGDWLKTLYDGYQKRWNL